MSNIDNKKNAVITSIKSTKLDSRLIELETGVRLMQKSFLDMGKFLTEIHNNELYTQRNFTTWENYINEIFDITRDYSYKIMNSFKIVEILKDAGYKGVNLPKTESQARPLARLITSDKNSDSNIIQVWALIVESKAKITAKLINEAVMTSQGKSTPKPENKKKDEITVPNNVGDIDQTPASKDDIQSELDKQLATNIELIQQLETVKRDTVEIPRHKLALQLYKAGFKAMSASIDKTDKEAVADLLELKTILLG
jgi:hypothetical protein